MSGHRLARARVHVTVLYPPEEIAELRRVTPPGEFKAALRVFGARCRARAAQRELAADAKIKTARTDRDNLLARRQARLRPEAREVGALDGAAFLATLPPRERKRRIAQLQPQVRKPIARAVRAILGKHRALAKAIKAHPRMQAALLEGQRLRAQRPRGPAHRSGARRAPRRVRRASRFQAAIRGAPASDGPSPEGEGEPPSVSVARPTLLAALSAACTPKSSRPYHPPSRRRWRRPPSSRGAR